MTPFVSSDKSTTGSLLSGFGSELLVTLTAACLCEEEELPTLAQAYRLSVDAPQGKYFIFIASSVAIVAS